jgi:predicted nucleic acid-binding protein
VIVIDNTVLSNFARTNHLHLLELFCQSRGLIVRAVKEEFQEGIRRGLFTEIDLSWFQQIDITSPEEIHLTQIFGIDLGKGESECLAIASCRTYELLTDDLDARQIGFREKICVSGSVGVLATLVRRNVIPLHEGNQVLNEFISKGYFSPVDSLDDII